MAPRSGIVFIAEELDPAATMLWSARFSAHWQSSDGESFVEGPQHVGVDEAIEWGRARADVVLVRVGGSDAYRSAGIRRPEAELADWREGTVVEPRREPGYEHLDLVADEEIEWEVRMEPSLDLGSRGEHRDRVRGAVEAADEAYGVDVRAAEDGGLAVRFVVRARSYPAALALALAVQRRLLAALPRRRARGPTYAPTGFDPADGVRPLLRR